MASKANVARLARHRPAASAPGRPCMQAAGRCTACIPAGRLFNAAAENNPQHHDVPTCPAGLLGRTYVYLLINIGRAPPPSNLITVRSSLGQRTWPSVRASSARTAHRSTTGTNTCPLVFQLKLVGLVSIILLLILLQGICTQPLWHDDDAPVLELKHKRRGAQPPLHTYRLLLGIVLGSPY